MAEIDSFNEMITSRLQEKKRSEQKRKKWLILLILLLLAGGIAGGYFLYEHFRPKSRYELDRNALEGFLPGKSEAEIQEELNRIIEEGRVNISMNPTPVIRDGKINVRIENVPANKYYLQVDVYLYPEKGNADNAELVYRSGVIRQEFYIEEGDAETDAGDGTYDGLAVFSALDPETMEEIGKTSMTLVITVED